MTMRILKRALSLFIVGLFVFTAFAVIQSGGSQAQASPSASSSFTFPYQYGTPTVPSDVGAQGIQGPTVPLSDLGAKISSNVGYIKSLIGSPNSPIYENGTFKSNLKSSVSVSVLYGTVTSNSAASGIYVSFINATFGTNYTSKTSASGVATFTLPEGWYYLSIIQSSSSYINFTQEININSATLNIVRYLIPSSYGSVAINNGPASSDRGNLYVKACLQKFPYDMPQVTISLFNASNSNSFLASAVTLSNGTAMFKNLNTAYTYNAEIDGYSQTLSGFREYLSNQTVNSITVSSDTTESPPPMVGYSGGTATVTGGASFGSTGYLSAWPTQNHNVTISGGYYIFSGVLNYYSAGGSLSLQNTTFFFNASAANSMPTRVTIANSTVIFIYNSRQFNINPPSPMKPIKSINITNSVIISSYVGDLGGEGNLWTYHGYYYNGWHNVNATNTIFLNQIMSGTGQIYGKFNNVKFIGGNPVTNGTYSNVAFLNNTIKLGLATVLHGSFSNTTLQLENSTTMNFVNMSETSILGGTSNYFMVLNNSEVKDYSWFDVSWKAVYLNNTFINNTIPYDSVGTIGIYAQTGIFNNASIYLGVPANISYSTFYNSISEWKSYEGIITFSLPLNLVMKNSIYNISYPMGNVSTLINNGTFYNDGLEFNYTISQINAHLYGSLDPLYLPYPTLGFRDNAWVNYSYLTFPNLGRFEIHRNATFSHDVIPWWVWGDPQGAFQMFTVVPTVPSNVIFSNDSFKYVYFNLTMSIVLQTLYIHSFGTASWYMEDGNMGGNVVGDKFIGTLYVIHSTFYGRMVGSGANINFPSDIMNVEQGVRMFVNDSLFLNDPSYDLGGSSIYNSTAPYATDISMGNNEVNGIYNNWFMNLNNETLPIAPENYDPASVNTFHMELYIDGNHFYFQPAVGSSHIAVHSMPLNKQMANTPTAYLTRIPYGSNASYEIPLAYNSSIVSANNYQFTSNSSVLQDANFNGTITSPNTTWAWSIAPDVNALSGTLTISYTNGLVGGPQPNFEWKGYNYSESVEPSYIQVGVNSSKAPSIDLQFSGVPGIKYLVQAFSQGSEFESFVENASSSGILNATYNPATMPLDPTFEVSPYVAPPPPYNPVQPAPPMNFFPAYVFYILLATSAAGVAAGIYIMIRRR